MKLWLILALGAFILAWSAIYGFLQVTYLLRQSAPKATGISLIYLFVGWGILTGITIPVLVSITPWLIVTAVYIVCFMTVFNNAESWMRAIDRFLPYD